MLSHNAGAVLQRMLDRKNAVTRELNAAARELGAELSGESKRVMQEGIYDVPIPLKKGSDKKLSPNAKVRSATTKGKHGAWQRTGGLKRAESWTTEGATIILRNNQRYAVARFTLGTPQGRAIRSPGVQSVQWQTEAIERKRARIVEVRRRAVLRGLSGGVV